MRWPTNSSAVYDNHSRRHVKYNLRIPIVIPADSAPPNNCNLCTIFVRTGDDNLRIVAGPGIKFSSTFNTDIVLIAELEPLGNIHVVLIYDFVTPLFDDYDRDLLNGHWVVFADGR